MQTAQDRQATLTTALTIVNAIPEIAVAARWLDAFAVAAALPQDMTEELQVVLDEVLANVIRHGLRDAPEGSRAIAVRIRRTSGCVMLTVIDDGPAFDPTAREPTEAAIRIAARQVGGAGLLMVRRLTDRSRYARAYGRNRLTLWKRLPG